MQTKVIERLIPRGRANRPGLTLIVEGVTVHNTANQNAGAGPTNTSTYVRGADAARRGASWHYHVGKDTPRSAVLIYRNLPEREVSWHAGDGYNGRGNRRTISIEVCENVLVGTEIDPEVRAATAALVSDICRRYSLNPLTDVVYQHNNWSGKNCPRLMRHNGRWERFMASVAKVHNGKPEDEPMTPQEREAFNELSETVSRIREDTYYLKRTTFGNATPVVATQSNIGILQDVTGNTYEIGTEITLTGDEAFEFASRMGLSLMKAHANLHRTVAALAQSAPIQGDADIAQILRDLADAADAAGRS